MSLQDKKNKKNRKGQFFGKNRKGVSIMVGYVLLVVFAIILSLFTYQWIKTYVPSDSLQCPDSGVSVSMKTVYYDCGNNTLYLTVKNSGRFNILGYFAHAANVSGQEIATIDLSQYFNETLSGGQRFGNSIAFTSAEQNLFKPGDEKAAIFNLIPAMGNMTSIQITPTRMQEVDGKNRFISCGDERVKQEIYCGIDTRIVDVTCTPDCAGRECGPDPVCGESCPPNDCEDRSLACDASGQCVDPASCTDDCIDYGYQCGTQTVCGVPRDCSAETGGCDPSTESCNEATGQCVSTVNDRNCDPGETCADSDCDEQQADECAIGEICQSGSCVFTIPGGPTGCSDYCALFEGYINGGCRQNSAQCSPGVYLGNIPGANASIGDGFCEEYGGPTDDTCCCYT